MIETILDLETSRVDNQLEPVSYQINDLDLPPSTSGRDNVGDLRWFLSPNNFSILENPDRRLYLF